MMNANDVVDALGGTNRVASVCSVTPGAVSVWRRRNRIPGEHWLTLSRAADAAGLAFTLEGLAEAFGKPALNAATRQTEV